MKKIIAVALLGIVVFSCKNSKTNLSGDQPVNAANLIKAFPELKLPLNIADTSLDNFGDTSVISYSVFAGFVPDSVLQTLLGKQVNDYVIHPAGRIHNDDGDYLVTKFSSGKKIKLVVFVLDSKHTYLSNYLLLDNHQSDKYRRNVSITSEPTFITKREKENAKNEVVYTRNGYAFNKASNNFTEVLNDSNEDQKKSNEIINPVDTLPSTNKFSGDYITDRKNFISIRDGKDALTYMFFIHFEKNGADCTGELKGEMTLTTETNAVYKESGDACVINFKFSGNNVSVKEEGNCGNHRGINCPYDFTFRKKKNK